MDEYTRKENRVRFMVYAPPGRPISNVGSRNRDIRNGHSVVRPSVPINIRSQSIVDPTNTEAGQKVALMLPKDHLTRYVITYSVQITLLVVFLGLLIGAMYA